MSSAAGASAAEVVHTLQVLASHLSADGHPLQAIKCYVAMMSQSMLPSDEAAARLRLGQLLMEHTLNVQDAKQQLQKAVGTQVHMHSTYGQQVRDPCYMAIVGWHG